MSTPISLNLVDYSNERSSTKSYLLDFNPATWVANVALAMAWRVAVEALSLCNEVSMTASLVLNTASGVAPANKAAQREFLIRVFYRDTVNGRAGSFTIPGPDLALLTLSGDEVSLTTGVEVIAMVAATNLMVSRDDNPIIVTRAILDGRHS